MYSTDPVTLGAAANLSGLAKHYGSVRAVDGVDLVIAPGEVVALLGPNGAGKSTTVDMLLGLTTPTSGTVAVFGRTPRAAMSAGLVGAMLQSGGMLEDATVAETVGLFAALYPKSLATVEAMCRAGVDELARRRLGTLSGGQRQRVRFAAALVSDPDLLVLDEPTVAMDVAARHEFWRAMRAYTDTGRTVVFATHYLAEAEEYADRVVLMRSGRVVADGSVAEVKALASGRLITARVPGATPAALSTVAGVREAAVRGELAELSCVDSDAALRDLLARFPQAHDIEVRGAGLEAAFLSLTSEEAA